MEMEFKGMQMGKIIGIDLGTTVTVCAITEGRETKVICNSEGARGTPSVVAFLEDGSRLVGRPAKSQAAVSPSSTIYSAKRLIGRRRHECTEEEKSLPYRLAGEAGDLAQIEVGGRKYYPSEISAMVLQDIKKSIERVIGERVESCVITVPAHFGDSQRQATKEAAEIAGLKVMRIINEPTAAALAYGLDKNKNECIIVIDWGGGTMDSSILQVGDGVFEVLATAGDLFLGGDDCDRAILNHVADEFQKASGCDIRGDSMALQRLAEASEKAKCDLSSLPQTTISIPYVTAVNGVPKHLSQTLTRSKFEQLCEPIFNRLRTPIAQVLRDAKKSPSDISTVVLVGGSSRIPKVVEICKEIFGKQPHQGVNPDEAIAIGAAIQGSVLSGGTTGIVLIDVTPLSLGVETNGGIMTPLIPRNTTIPTSKSEVFSTASDNQPIVDIHVLQGERRMASGNRTLGRFQMSGIAPKPRGQPRVEVTFDIDANGILSVTSKDKDSGKEHKVEIKGSSGLPQEDIKRMMADAAAYEAEDKSKAEMIEVRNKADNVLYETEKFMREHAKMISVNAHSGVKAAVDALRNVMEAIGTKDQIASAIDAVELANKKMYDECFSGSKQGAPATTPQSAPSGDVIEADFAVM